MALFVLSDLIADVLEAGQCSLIVAAMVSGNRFTDIGSDDRIEHARIFNLDAKILVRG